MTNNFKALRDVELDILGRKVFFEEGELYPPSTYTSVYDYEFEDLLFPKIAIEEVVIYGGEAVLDLNPKELNFNKDYEDKEEI